MDVKATNTICIQIQSRSLAKAALVLLKVLE